jgi:hypothetical protein
VSGLITNCALRGAVLGALLVGALAGPAAAYTGGPLRIEIAGYEPLEAKFLYPTQAHDESWSPPRIYYLDLRGDRPEHAVRARSLEPSPHDIGGWALVPAWLAFRTRLVVLPVESEFEITLRANSSRIRDTDPEASPAFLISCEIESMDRRAYTEIAAHCGPLVRVQGLYRIPGRPERLAVLSYTGRAYGCEEVEKPILLR